MEAYSASQLLEQASSATVMAGHLTNKQKCAISEKLAVCAHRLLDGGAEFMQLTDLGCTIIMANNNPWPDKVRYFNGYLKNVNLVSACFFLSIQWELSYAAPVATSTPSRTSYTSAVYSRGKAGIAYIAAAAGKYLRTYLLQLPTLTARLWVTIT